MKYQPELSLATFGGYHIVLTYFGLILMHLQLNFDNSAAFNSARVTGLSVHPHRIFYANGVS